MSRGVKARLVLVSVLEMKLEMKSASSRLPDQTRLENDSVYDPDRRATDLR